MPHQVEVVINTLKVKGNFWASQDFSTRIIFFKADFIFYFTSYKAIYKRLAIPIKMIFVLAFAVKRNGE